MTDVPLPPFRRQFDAARDPLTARNALGLTDTTGAKAPASAEYVTAATDATLTNERVLTNTATVTWDLSTAGQAKANAAGFGNVSNSGTPVANQLAIWTSATTIKGDAKLTWNGTAVSLLGSANPQLYLNKTASGGGNYIVGFTAGASRWQMIIGDYATETGSGNTGSDFRLMRCNDAGAALDYPILIPRATGLVEVATSPAASDSSTKIATTAFVKTYRDAFCATLGGVNQAGFTTAVWAKGNFNTEVFDTNSKYDSATNMRWTPAAGPVLINAQIFMGSLTAGASCNCAIYKNGAIYRQGAYGPQGDGGTTAVAAVTVLDNANGTDYYECWGLVAGAAGGTLSGSTQLTFFQGYQL